MVMSDSDIYFITKIDNVEDLEKYIPGGYHPVNLYDIINDRFQIVHKLGYGGFATIWLARDLKENRNVALKIMVADSSASDLTILDYIQAQDVGQTSFVVLRDTFTIEGPNGIHQCLVMDVIGPSLKLVADRRHPLPQDMIRDAALQTVKGVGFLHSIGITHDLTSSNILFELKGIDAWCGPQVYEYLGEPRRARVRTRSGAAPAPHAPSHVVESMQYEAVSKKHLTGKVYISDFGESFFSNKPPSELLGTPVTFAAPELFFGQPPSPASDIWALACVLFELRASRPLILAFFGLFQEALAETVHTLGPLPKEWQKHYIHKSDGIGEDHWWFKDTEMRHSLEYIVKQTMTPMPTELEAGRLLDLLRSAMTYEPSKRVSAEDLARHPWFTA